MKMYCDQNIRTLMNNENDPAGYCCDEAWYSNAYPDEYKKLVDNNDKYKYVQIACKSIEDGAEYGTAEGPLQHEMYDMLFNYADLTIEERDLLNSKDRMTNFSYVLRIILRLLQTSDYTKEESRKLADFAYSGRARPTNKELWRYGYSKHISLLKEHQNLAIELEDFAQRTSSLGNYSCIPSFHSINERKGNARKPLFIRGNDRFRFRVNDQFALFAEWINKNESRLSRKNKRIVDQWKDTMLLNNVWDIYAEAAEKYKSVWTQESKDLEKIREHRLTAFADYLKLVNEAIKLRSEQIARTLASSD